MINFDEATFVNLAEIEPAKSMELVGGILVDGESIFAGFKTIRDQVVFTNKRLIAINVQGLTGKKKDFTSLPYSKIQAWSVQTPGLLGVVRLSDAEMELWFAGLGHVKFQFTASFDIKGFNQILAPYIL